jgi:hypothetical protein
MLLVWRDWRLSARVFVLRYRDRDIVLAGSLWLLLPDVMGWKKRVAKGVLPVGHWEKVEQL